MSTIKHRRVVTAGRPSVATYPHGREKLRCSALGTGSTSTKLIRPDGSIVNAAIRIFAIGRNQAGFWVARDCDGSACGLFLSKGGAVRFAKRTSEAEGCALMFVSNGLELKPHTAMTRAWHNIIPLELAKLIARLKLRIKDLWVASRQGNEPRDLIEQELYRNRYPHRSKCDDDLPIERDGRDGTSAPND